MDNVVFLIVAAVMTGLLSLAVAIALIQNTKSAGYLVRYGTPFAAGVLLVAAFRDLLPHGVEEHGVVALNAALGAIIVFFLIEKAFSGFHHHHEEDKTVETGNKTQGWLFLVGDVFHNGIDGIALGTAFLIDVNISLNRLLIQSLLASSSFCRDHTSKSLNFLRHHLHILDALIDV